MSDNMRRRQRLEFEESILCHKHIITSANIQPDSTPISINITDISYSGLGIKCDRDLGRGDFLLLNLINRGISKEYMLEVKWCKYAGGSYEAGLEFTSLTRDMIIFLDDIIKNHLRIKTRLERSV